MVITDYECEGNKILSIRQIIFEYPEDCELNTFESEGEKVLELIPKMIHSVLIRLNFLLILII